MLGNEGVKSRCFHKDIPQNVREMALQKFKYERRVSIRQPTNNYNYYTQGRQRTNFDLYGPCSARHRL